MNQHGLDTHYFKKNLEKIILEIDYYTPEEVNNLSLPTVGALGEGSGLKKPLNFGNNSFLELWIDQTQVANYLASYVR